MSRRSNTVTRPGTSAEAVYKTACPLSSSIIHHQDALPGPSTLTSTATNGGDNVVKPNSKNKKKKKESKEARLRRREEQRFKEIYGPKDSHIQLISPEAFARLQAQQNNTKNIVPNKPQVVPVFPSPVLSQQLSFPSDSVWSRRSNLNHIDVEREFPTLGSPALVSSKQCPLTPVNTGVQEVLERSVTPPGHNTSQNEDSNNMDLLERQFPTLAISSAIVSMSKNDKVEKERLEHLGDASIQSRELIGQKVSSVEANENGCNENDELAAGQSVMETSSLDVPGVKRLNKKKPSKTPIVINIEELLSTMNDSKQKKEGAKATKRLSQSMRKKLFEVNEKTQRSAGNPLDSSGVKVMHRGKMREKPKRKKPSRLKRAILLSRELRKNLLIDSDNKQKTITSSNLEKSQEDGYTGDSNILTKEIKIETVVGLKALQMDGEGAENEANNLIYDEPVINIGATSESQEPEAVDPLEVAKNQIHSRKFRKYCDMYVSKELHGHIIVFLKELHRLQDKLYKTDLMKYKLKRKYVQGIKEINNYLSINKVQLIIMAPDIESNTNVKGMQKRQP